MSMSPLRWLLVAGIACGLTAATLQTPKLLRRMAFFQIERVEVNGTRHLAPQQAVLASGIVPGANVFDDSAPWRRSLLRHPLVSDVRIERRLPGTVVVSVLETEPVLLARTPELRPVDAQGRVLPIELSAATLDLPVLSVSSEVDDDGRLRQPGALALVAAYDRLRRLDPTLGARVSEVHPAPGGFRLILRRPTAAEALLPANAGPVQIRQLQLALADLLVRGELDRLRRLDVRYRDQVVVTLKPHAG